MLIWELQKEKLAVFTKKLGIFYFRRKRKSWRIWRLRDEKRNLGLEIGSLGRSKKLDLDEEVMVLDWPYGFMGWKRFKK